MNMCTRALWVVLCLCSAVFAKVSVVASTTDLAAIARAVGGEAVHVEAIAQGDGNPHAIEVLPSSMMKVARAQLYLKVGLGLDLWAQPIIDGARNKRLRVVDCSRGVPVLEQPSGRVDASMGDVHPEGNPHYWLDPANGLLIAATIRDALCAADPAHAGDYRSRCTVFEGTLSKRMAAWSQQALPLRGMPVVSYHRSWPYFARAFHLDVVGFVEPKPGIEPTPAHTAQLVELITSRKVPVIIREPYFSRKVPERLASLTGARVVVLAPSVGSRPGVDDYLALFDYNLAQLLAAKGR